VATEGFRESHVDLMVGEPEGGFGDERRELLQLDAVELIDVQAGEVADIEAERKLFAVLGPEDIEFEGAQLPVGDDEEVAAAAGRVEETQGGELVVKLVEGFGPDGAGAALGKLGL